MGFRDNLLLRDQCFIIYVVIVFISEAGEKKIPKPCLRTGVKMQLRLLYC
jgi:hypothetical protein